MAIISFHSGMQFLHKKQLSRLQVNSGMAQNYIKNIAEAILL